MPTQVPSAEMRAWFADAELDSRISSTRLLESDGSLEITNEQLTNFIWPKWLAHAFWFEVPLWKFSNKRHRP